MAAKSSYKVMVGFLPGQRVKIVDLENGEGLVIGVSIGLECIQFNVRYWHNGERKEAWFIETELDI